MGKDMFEKSIYQIYLNNASSSGISIIVPKFSRDRMYSLPEFQNRRDFHLLYSKYVDLMKDMYGKEWVSFNLAETTVLFEIIAEIAGEDICYMMKCGDCEYGEIYREQLLDGVRESIKYLQSHTDWYCKEKEFYLGCKDKWSEGWTDRDVAMDSLKELEEFLSSVRNVTVVIEDDMESCEHENMWYAADIYRREMKLERLKMFTRMLEEINGMEYAVCGARNGAMIDDGEGGEIPEEMPKASNELDSFIMFAKDEEMMIMFGDHIDDDLYNCFDDAQFRIDRWLNL